MSYKLLWLWGCKVTRLQGWLHCALVFLERLTNVAQQLAADIEFSGLFIGHHPFAGGHDHGAKAIDDTWYFIGTCEFAQAGSADAHQIADDRLFGGRVIFQGNSNGTLLVFGSFFFELVFKNVTLIVQNFRDRLLNSGSRNFHDPMTGHLRVADAGQIICYRVGYLHLSMSN